MLLDKDFKPEEVDFVLELLDFLDDLGYEVTHHQVLKENGVKLDGLAVRGNDMLSAPTIYLQSLFRDLNRGVPKSELFQHVLGIIRQKSYDFSDLLNCPRESVLSNLFPVVVNYSMNKELLQDIPHRVFADGELAYYPRWRVESDDVSGTIKVTKDLLSRWELSKDEILDIALDNVRGSYSVQSLCDVLQGMMSEDIPLELMGDTEPPMYVVSNHDRCFGAAFLADPVELQRIANKYDAYILPSSIHECILIPRCYVSSVDDLMMMVQSINASEVPQEDILSNRVFDIGKGNRLVVAKTNGITEDKVTETLSRCLK